MNAALLGALFAALVGCGGEGVDAPYTGSGDRCPDVDDYLAPVLELASNDAFPTLKVVMSEDLSDDDRHDLVALAIDIVRALEPGDVSGLGRLEVRDGVLEDLEGSLAALASWFSESAPGAPYDPTMHALVTALNTCDGGPVLVLAEALLLEDKLVRAILGALQAPDLDVEAILEGLDSPDGEPRTGLRALLKNLLVAATQPDFDVGEWTGLLGVIVDVNGPPWADVVEQLEAFMASPSRLQAVQSMTSCLLAVDPELVWVDPLYDLLTAPPELSLSIASFGGEEPLLPEPLEGPMEAVFSILQEDASARQTLVVTLSAMCSPPRAAGVMAEVATLLDAGVLPGVIDAMVAVASRSCAP